MLKFIVRRVLLMIPTLFIISALVYFIIDLPPGDCVTSQIDELLARGDADALCRQVKASGQTCFVRAGAGDALAAWAKPGVRLASR